MTDATPPAIGPYTTSLMSNPSLKMGETINEPMVAAQRAKITL